MSNNIVTTKKKRELTELQKNFLEHLKGSAKGDISKAIELAGYSEHARPHEMVHALKDEIMQIAQELLAYNAVKAVHGLTDVLSNPSRLGSANVINAAKEILDRGGILKKGEDSGRVSIKADNVVILPPKQGNTSKTIDLDEDDYILIQEQD